ncbi:MAG TPA: hypothetical protein VHI78_06320 [Bacteroidales bacterium]|jgi:hypothetical protein|nr:hypothetical protein [Bacteroidales bacterium]
MPVNVPFRKYLITITLYSIAMGFLESAVVVYLREIYYPYGFEFPMVSMTGRIAVTEILREAATMIMLLTVAMLAGKSFLERFSWFIYCFAIWDIFYYIFLKLLTGWPSSLLTWDILFLIPVIWTGPVITPVIVSLTMIIMAMFILTGKIKATSINSQWLVLLGAFFIFLSFVWDFSGFMLSQYNVAEMFKPGISQHALQQYVPYRFNWWFFVIGEVMILTGIAFSHHNTRRKEYAA